MIDALKPSMLERAIANGRAPALARIRRDGCYVDDCVAAFPSVTPVCAATITTGVGPDGHWIPSMNWYHREEGRYVEYGSSFSASRQFGVLRSLTDTVYRMNAEHLSTEVETVYESLDDADVRTAGTTYLIYRGRYRARGLQRDRAGPDRHLDPVPADDPRPARAVLRRPLRQPQDRLPRPARDARDPRSAHRLRRGVPGRERPVRLHAVLAPRQRRLVAQERTARPGDLDRGRRPTARAADARRRRPRRVPRRARGDRHLRSLPGCRRGADPPGSGVCRVRRRDAQRRAIGRRRGRPESRRSGRR